MSKVIEILDSDDDVTYQKDEVSDSLHPSLENTRAAIPIVSNLVGCSREKELAFQSEIGNVITTTPKASTATPNAPDSPRKARSRHRRKSVHQPMRASPEMQFETISLDDEDDDRHNEAGTFQAQQPNIGGKAKSSKTMPKILAAKPASTEELIQAACDEFFGGEEINSAIRQIAEERVRINFLLASYGMPDINFSLYTQYERLKFQFEDRLKQRKMRSWMTGQENKIKKHRLPKESQSAIH